MKIMIVQNGIKHEIEEPHEEQTLPEMIAHMESLLIACGYCFDGDLKIVDEDL